MTTDRDIRHHVGRYLAGEIDLRELRSQLTPMRWDTENPPTPEAMRLLRPLGRYFAEYSNGDWTGAEMRDVLLPFGPVKITASFVASKTTVKTFLSTSASGASSAIEGGSRTTVRTVTL